MTTTPRIYITLLLVLLIPFMLPRIITTLRTQLPRLTTQAPQGVKNFASTAAVFGVGFNMGQGVGTGGAVKGQGAGEPARDPMVKKSDKEWQAQLSPEQFRVVRQQGTERPGTGKYNHHSADGVYNCVACDAPLYKSTTKFDSGCGWPAFFDALPGAVGRREDNSLFSKRIEIVCNNCGGHLGHVFQGEGLPVPTDERHCVNSVSLNFEPEK